jgi:hypothetical protein
MLQNLWNALSPWLIDVLATGLAALLGWIGMMVRAKIGLDIEASLRAALKEALDTGAQNAVAGGLSGPTAISATIAHAQRSVPGALKALAPTESVLINLAKAKLAQITRTVSSAK